jgi:hypothetical protein
VTEPYRGFQTGGRCGRRPAAGGLGVDELQSGGGGPVGEKAVAAAQDDRVDEQAVLVDQVVLHEHRISSALP